MLKRTLLAEVVGGQPDHGFTFQAKPVSTSRDRRIAGQHRAQPMITGGLAAPSAGVPFSDAVIAGEGWHSSPARALS